MYEKAMYEKAMTNDPKPVPITEDELDELFTFKQDPNEIVEGDGVVSAWALAWFPKDEWAKAISTWPDLLDAMPADHSDYSKKIEGHLKAAAAREPGSPDVSPLNVADLISEAGDDAGEPLARAKMGAKLAREGNAISWPPGRNDACWCRSGVKYKSCCGPTAATG